MKIRNWHTNDKTLIIAEIGNNHEGNLETAIEMVDAAADSGADVVKFQMIEPQKLVSRDQIERINQLKKFSLSKEDFTKIAKRSNEKGVIFMATPFYLEAVHFLNDLVPAFKLASSDIDFYPLIRAIAVTKKPVLISCGTATKNDILKARDILEDIWKGIDADPGYAFLHCVSNYPTDLGDANLKRILRLKKLFPIVGYSDHTLGIDSCIVAVSLGAKIIEKHFTLDKTRSTFHDHQLSADPDDFQEMVTRIRAVETIISDGPSLDELDFDYSSIRRVAAASRDLICGEKIESKDLLWLRPGENKGISLSNEGDIIGKVLIKDVRVGEIIKLEDIKR